jgi:hypothetical protein
LTWDPQTGLQPASAPTSRSTTPNPPQTAQYPPRPRSRAEPTRTYNTWQNGVHGQEYNNHGNPVSRLVREAEANQARNNLSYNQVPPSPTPAFQNWPNSDTGASLFGSSSIRPISVSSTEEGGAGANWECLQCTFHNHDIMEKCEICDAPRARHPASRRQPVPATTRVQKPLPPDPPVERPLGWLCTVCGTYMENHWWTCSQCGTMKASS